MSLENYAITEIVWTALNLITLLAAVVLYVDSRRTLAAVLASGENGLYLMAARHDRRRFAIKLFIAGAFTAAGLYAGLAVPPNPDLPPGTSGIPLTVVFLMVADFGLLALIFEDARQRLSVAEYLTKHGRPNTETRDQVEDREFGDKRRDLEVEHAAESERLGDNA